LKEDETDGKESKHVYLESVHWTKAELLGTGAFSTCYAARDKASGTLMAVKQVIYTILEHTYRLSSYTARFD
jgi:hypothetical protein